MKNKTDVSKILPVCGLKLHIMDIWEQFSKISPKKFDKSDILQNVGLKHEGT